MKILTFAIFLFIVAITLAITYWAARRTKSTSAFYAAGGDLSASQNGMALAGDWMSAAAFLGFTGLSALYGMDGSLYAVGALVAFLPILVIVAEPLRNTGKYTVADVIAYRMQSPHARMASVVGSIVVNIAYLVPQMAGAGVLIKLLVGIPYNVSVVVVGALMIVYVAFGGMIATTWARTRSFHSSIQRCSVRRSDSPVRSWEPSSGLAAERRFDEVLFRVHTGEEAHIEPIQ